MFSVLFIKFYFENLKFMYITVNIMIIVNCTKEFYNLNAKASYLYLSFQSRNIHKRIQIRRLIFLFVRLTKADFQEERELSNFFAEKGTLGQSSIEFYALESVFVNLILTVSLVSDSSFMLGGNGFCLFL